LPVVLLGLDSGYAVAGPLHGSLAVVPPPVPSHGTHRPPRRKKLIFFLKNVETILKMLINKM
jgi:hypothetical protein